MEDRQTTSSARDGAGDTEDRRRGDEVEAVDTSLGILQYQSIPNRHSNVREGIGAIGSSFLMILVSFFFAVLSASGLSAATGSENLLILPLFVFVVFLVVTLACLWTVLMLFVLGICRIVGTVPSKQSWIGRRIAEYDDGL